MKMKKHNTEQVLQWFNYFVDYVESMNNNLYNEACEYADSQELENQNKDDGESDDPGTDIAIDMGR